MYDRGGKITVIFFPPILFLQELRINRCRIYVLYHSLWADTQEERRWKMFSFLYDISHLEGYRAEMNSFAFDIRCIYKMNLQEKSTIVFDFKLI